MVKNTPKITLFNFIINIIVFLGQGLCTAMSECKELSNQTCPDCLSGQKECENLENQCWINGLCKGRLIEEVRNLKAHYLCRKLLIAITVKYISHLL
jgi:hypothetical protein